MKLLYPALPSICKPASVGRENVMFLQTCRRSVQQGTPATMFIRKILCGVRNAENPMNQGFFNLGTT